MYVCFLMIFPAMAEMQSSYNDKLMEFNGVYIPSNAQYEYECNDIVYYDFYDSVNGMHYAFYNPETGEHFAMSDPKREYIYENTEEKALGKGRTGTAHEYSFETRSEVNGKHNKVTFNVPATELYLSGDAKIKRMSDKADMTQNYDGYRYTIKVCQDKWVAPQTKTFSGTAGSGISGTLNTKNDAYYLIINAVDRFKTDVDCLYGSGRLYY